MSQEPSHTIVHPQPDPHSHSHPHPHLEKMRRFLRLHRLNPLMRRIIVGTLGGFLLLIGVVMIIAPGPAFLMIPLALIVLGTEFVWAQAMHGRVMRKVEGMQERRRLKKADAAKARAGAGVEDS